MNAKLLIAIQDYGRLCHLAGNCLSQGREHDSASAEHRASDMEKEIILIFESLCTCRADNVDDCMFWDDGWCGHEK